MKTYTQLTQEERYQIEDLLASGCSQDKIAAMLDRHKSSISCEIRRNSMDGRYRAGSADRQAHRRRHGKSRSRIGEDVRRFVDILLCFDWSPEQVSGWLAMDMDVPVSHEWIYLHNICGASGNLLSGFFFRLTHRSPVCNAARSVAPR